ncbi:aminotransferase [uncultured Parasphingopyxis sp.]|uniref:aminotransferase n=1 Tax=uncultured Parasphingopyxis sp. TaxID=1547918 RepID=UPI0026271EBA|nr:aminotransferase [uncultured Parasphingopyxis sp.]
MNPVYASLPTTIFEEMSGLARAHDAINLGQGFPDAAGPEDVRRKAAEASVDGYNQYPPMRGLPELREAIAAHYGAHQGLAIDPDTQVCVTSGATEALAASILAVLSPGDEAIVIQPAYDAYAPLIRRAGATPRFVSLAPPDWKLTRETLESAVTAKTRAIVVNTPLNPLGTMMGEEELKVLAEFCIAHDLIAISDEVWEHVRFGGAAHRSPLDLPGMAGRTIKIGSAGKVFSLTGWKTGWAIAAPALIDMVAKAHQFLTFTTPPNLQTAVAYGLGKDDDYFAEMRAGYQRARDRLAFGLEAAGYAVLAPPATYFLSIDLAASGIALDDRNFCRRIVEEHGVAAIPVSAFYEEEPVSHLARLCFAKANAVLDVAIERLAGARKALG